MYRVLRYDKKEDYLNPEIQGKVIVSRKRWDEAVEWRDHYRKHCPENYYNITHATPVAVIESEEGCKAP